MFGLDFIRNLKPCKWRYKESLDDGVEHFGFIAQEVDELVSHKEYGFVVVDEQGIYKLQMAEFIAPIIKAIQELENKLNSLRS